MITKQTHLYIFSWGKICDFELLFFDRFDILPIEIGLFVVKVKLQYVSDNEARGISSIKNHSKRHQNHILDQCDDNVTPMLITVETNLSKLNITNITLSRLHF